VAHVKQDIDRLARHVEALCAAAVPFAGIQRQDLLSLGGNLTADEMQVFQAALHWFASDMQSIFIQDANSLIVPPDDLLEILEHLKSRFPGVERITSYARSHTIARISDGNLAAMRKAGLNRIHIGLESGSDAVLKLVKKGVDQKTHVKAGLKIKRAGMELSEYVMPGLGGRKLSREHALGTAEALNQINPDFIRLRTLAIPDSVELFHMQHRGDFEKCSDLETVREIRLFIASLKQIDSRVMSDHILNLFEELQGRLPDDQPAMLRVLDGFLALAPEMQCSYQVGRRLGIMNGLKDLENPRRLARVEAFCRKHGITPANVDQVIDGLMRQFI
jgi:hypothetical protein